MSLTRAEFEQLGELISIPNTWDGHFACETVRASLKAKGLISSWDGWNTATYRGVKTYFFSPSANRWRLARALRTTARAIARPFA